MYFFYLDGESEDIEFNIHSQLQHQGFLLEQVDLVTSGILIRTGRFGDIRDSY